MKFWISHIRNVETFVDDYPRLLEVWAAGGVDGLVLGPMTFGCAEILAHSRRTRVFRPADRARAPFDPAPDIYAKLGADVPPAPDGDDADLRQRLHTALQAVVDRGWELWLFDPFTGAVGPDLNDNATRILDPRARRSLAARMLDTIAAFPMATGVIIDGPAWGFEITEIDLRGMERRRLMFELPASGSLCKDLGYDLGVLRAAQDELERSLHSLTPQRVRLHATGGTSGALSLLAGPGHVEWLRFRADALTSFYEYLKGVIDEYAAHPMQLAVCPRTPAIAPVAGYDYQRVADTVDVVMPKLYYWHRGYDGLIGTAWRWATTLMDWNHGLTVRDACLVTRAFYGSAMPLLDSLIDFDRLITPEYLAELTALEAGRAVAAVADRARLVPWVDSGRAPHDGDPLTAAHLDATLNSVAGTGIDHFTYFNSTKLTAADWTMLCHHCGTPWDPRRAQGWLPPDLPTL